MLQLEAGARLHGKGQRVAHVVEILDKRTRILKRVKELTMRFLIALL